MQDALDTIDESLPSQFVVSLVKVDPSLYLMVTVYAVMVLPFSVGFVQLITTVDPLIVVVGAVGVDGSVAHNNVNTDEKAENP